METQEIDSTLDELENRLDRLRGLYEQYFLGIEKIEPSVARKDVDRRFWVLRRTQIRNTARRFRLQVLVQRYNTFQQYWTRICREIENGTYARHLLKAQKNLGAEPKTWAAKKRLGLLRRGGVLDPNGAAAAGNGAGDSVAPGESAPPPVGNTPPPPPGVAVEGTDRPRPSPPLVRGGAVTLTLDDLGPLDLDFDDELAPPPRQPPAVVPAARPPLPPRTSPAATPGRAAGPAIPPSPAAARPAPARPVAPLASPSPAAARPVAPLASPSPAAARPVAPLASPSPAAARPVAPLASPSPAAAKPVAPLAPLAPASPSPPAAVRPAGGVPSGALSEERVQKLYAELVETKRKLNQTNTVSVDSLARSLRETEKKLRAEHAGRSVDFQIVVKDGKPVVKPVVRK